MAKLTDKWINKEPVSYEKDSDGYITVIHGKSRINLKPYGNSITKYLMSELSKENKI